MKPFARLLLILFAGATWAVDQQPEPATIITAAGSEIVGNVISETLDAVEYRLGAGDAEATTSLTRAKIRAVVYQNEISDLEFNKSRGAFARKEYDKAATGFLVAAGGGTSFRVREEALLGAADAFRQARKPDDALKALAELEAKAPRSVLLPRAYGLRVAILLETGDRTKVDAALVALTKFDPIRAATARADLQRADKKPAEAAKELQAVWANAPRQAATESEPTYDSIGFQLAADLLAADNASGANEVFVKLCYGSASGSGRSRAHLALAKALSESSKTADLQAAIDHALMGGAISGGDKQGAKKIAQVILAKFDKDPALAKEAAEYRASINAL